MNSTLPATDIAKFQAEIMKFYKTHRRDHLPWRQAHATGSFGPYHILVSEVMLQQTQVSRVIPKFLSFTRQFPSVDVLAAAPLDSVLREWSGLGYNRRAKFLHQAAQIVVQVHGGAVPTTVEQLVHLPGIGKNTAAAISVYSTNSPHAFIETNIRSVFIDYFFADRSDVHDAEILPLVEQTVLSEDPRQWYWALMDYGSDLKKRSKTLSAKSIHYTPQSRFEGSRRQIRGQLIKRLLVSGELSEKAVQRDFTDPRTSSVIEALVEEGFLVQDQGGYRLSK